MVGCVCVVCECTVVCVLVCLIDWVIDCECVCVVCVVLYGRWFVCGVVCGGGLNACVCG